MTPSIAQTRLRKLSRLRNSLEEYQALIVLCSQYNASVRREREQALAALEMLAKRELDSAIVQVANQVRALRIALGARYSGAECVRMLRHLESYQGELLFVPKWLLKRYFGNVGDFLQIDDLPEHARISVDYKGTQPASTPGEVRITEAALFEDMCAMFNQAWELAPKCMGSGATKREIKASAAARRGAVVAAFYLIEAYLNSLAFDHVANHEDELSAADLGKLTE